MKASTGNETLLHMVARQRMRNAVLAAMLAEGDGEFDTTVIAWQEVDDAAKGLAKARRAFDRHCRELAKQRGPL